MGKWLWKIRLFWVAISEQNDFKISSNWILHNDWMIVLCRRHEWGNNCPWLRIITFWSSILWQNDYKIPWKWLSHYWLDDCFVEEAQNGGEPLSKMFFGRITVFGAISWQEDGRKKTLKIDVTPYWIKTDWFYCSRGTSWKRSACKNWKNKNILSCNLITKGWSERP